VTPVSQLENHRVELLDRRVLHYDVSAGYCRCHHQRTRLDTVRDHSVLGAVQTLPPLDLDHMSAGAADSCTHRDQHTAEVLDLGLARSVFNCGPPSAERGRHHYVLGSPDGGIIEPQARTGQMIGPCLDITIAELNARTQGAQTPDMQIDRACADRATTGG